MKSVKQVAAESGLSESTIRRIIREGKRADARIAFVRKCAEDTANDVAAESPLRVVK
jgi:hypothetical protein